MNPFNHIDHIFLINLPERTDRLMDSLYEVEKIGLKQRVAVVEGLKPGNMGFIETTYNILSRVDRTTLILGDDIKFINTPLKTFEVAYKEISLEDWDLLYLGASPQQKLLKRYDNWYLLKYGLTSHAIVYHRRIIPTMVKMLESFLNKPSKLDHLLLNWIQPNYTCLLIDPMICVQQSKKLDIQSVR